MKLRRVYRCTDNASKKALFENHWKAAGYTREECPLQLLRPTKPCHYVHFILSANQNWDIPFQYTLLSAQYWSTLAQTGAKKCTKIKKITHFMSKECYNTLWRKSLKSCTIFKKNREKNIPKQRESPKTPIISYERGNSQNTGKSIIMQYSSREGKYFMREGNTQQITLFIVLE